MNPLSPALGLTLALQVKLVVSNVLSGNKERVLVNGSCELSTVTLESSLDKEVVPFSHEMSELEIAKPVSVAALTEMEQVRLTEAL